MKNLILLQELTPEQLENLIEKSLKKSFNNFSKDLKNNQEKDELLSRAEVCDFLRIDSSTLWHWTNKGKVIAYGIANRRYYKRSELLNCLTQLKK